MITFSKRLDKAIRISAWAHEQAGQHRKGSDIPYIVHPVGVLLIAGKATDDEDTFIACLLHDVLEDVDESVYDESQMRADFGDRVVSIVLDVTKNDAITDWHERSRAYLDHLETKACDEAVVVSISDKIHNLLSTLIDLETYGDAVWQRFATKSSADQLWWYESILQVSKNRAAPGLLITELENSIEELKLRLTDGRKADTFVQSLH